MGLITRTATVALTGLMLTGCVTRGAFRDAMAEQQAALDAERVERIAADERLASDLAGLRSDLDALRGEFGAQIEAVAQGLQFVMPVHFAFDDDRVRAEDYETLERFARVVDRHYAGALVTVEGFTDPAGTAAYNRALSQRRAEAVRDHLMAQGIRAQLRPIGYGEERLVVPAAAKDDPGAELNRRVVFVIETPGQAEAAVTAGNLEG
jgi:outer membrane protein OmpA-like peptidoglycan-associated protein